MNFRRSQTLAVGCLGVVTILMSACSDMALYEGMRTQQQQSRDTNRSSPDPLPTYDNFKKERDAMRPAGP